MEIAFGVTPASGVPAEHRCDTISEISSFCPLYVVKIEISGHRPAFVQEPAGHAEPRLRRLARQRRTLRRSTESDEVWRIGSGGFPLMAS